MDAALEAVIADAETAHLHPGARRHVIRVNGRRKDALGSVRQSAAERRNASPTEVRNFRKRMEPATFVPHPHSLVALDFEIRGIEPPRRVSDNRARKRRSQERVKFGQRHVAFFERAAAHRSPIGIPGIAVVPDRYLPMLTLVLSLVLSLVLAGGYDSDRAHHQR